MSKRQVDIELPAKVWEIIDTKFKLKDETDSVIISNIVKNHLSSNGYYPDADSLQQGSGLRDIDDIHQDMIVSMVDLLEKKGIATFHEYNQMMQERIIKNARSFN